ncbi:hypothetical protein ABEX78_23230 [Priestia megaterium]
MKKILIILLTAALFLSISVTPSSAASDNKQATVYKTSVPFNGKKYPISLVVFDDTYNQQKAELINFKYFCKLYNISYTQERISVSPAEKGYKDLTAFLLKLGKKNEKVNGVITLVDMSNATDLKTSLTFLATSAELSKYGYFGNDGGASNMPLTQFSSYLKKNPTADRDMAIAIFDQKYRTITGLKGAKEVIKMGFSLNKTGFKLIRKSL